MNDIPLRRVLLDGVPTWKYRCPICGTWGYIDEDQYRGRVSIQCGIEGCTYHETLDVAERMGERLAKNLQWNMELLPFGSFCLACGSHEASFQFCTERCEQTSPGQYEAVRRIGDKPYPHLHRVCRQCKYEWLERCLAMIVEEKKDA